MKPLERTVSIVEDLAGVDEGDFVTFDISEYDSIRVALHNARHEKGQVTKPLWGRTYVLRKIPQMFIAFVGRPEEMT